FLAHGRDQNLPAFLRDLLGLIDPHAEDAGYPLEAFLVVSQAPEQILNPTRDVADIALPDHPPRSQVAVRHDRGLDLGERRVVKRVLKLTGTQDHARVSRAGLYV